MWRSHSITCMWRHNIGTSSVDLTVGRWLNLCRISQMHKWGPHKCILVFWTLDAVVFQYSYPKHYMSTQPSSPAPLNTTPLWHDWLINSILDNIGRKNSIRVWNQHLFLWCGLMSGLHPKTRGRGWGLLGEFSPQPEDPQVNFYPNQIVHGVNFYPNRTIKFSQKLPKEWLDMKISQISPKKTRGKKSGSKWKSYTQQEYDIWIPNWRVYLRWKKGV